MEVFRRVSGYDLFKLIVAILLLILFFFLLQRPATQAFTPASTGLPPTTTISSNPSATIGASPATVTASSTPLSLTTTSSMIPSPTEAIEPSPSPSPTNTSIVEPTETQTPATQVASACEAATSRSRLQAGMNATILRRLNFRSSPGIQDNWLLTNIPGTQVEIVSGPECVPYWTGAYVWWQIKLPDGRIGWSAERSLHGTSYFMEPLH